jgi:hypothetical protein
MYQVDYHSMHFLFNTLKMQKNRYFALVGIFCLGTFIIRLAYLAKDCILLLSCRVKIENCTIFIYHIIH